MSKIKNFKMYVDGEWVDSSSGKKIETLNPENNAGIKSFFSLPDFKYSSNVTPSIYLNT